MKENGIARMVEYLLSRSPSAAGLRLKSQRDLGELFGVHESQIRKALERLVKKGLLVRRRGSGSFVRRVADAITLSPEELENIPSESIFTGVPEESVSSADVIRYRTRLNIGLWSDLQFTTTPTNHKILEGIASAVNTRGHQLTIHSLLEDHSGTMPVVKIREQLREHRCDGYLVLSAWDSFFARAVGETYIPIMYFSLGTQPMTIVNREPLAMLHTSEAAARGVRLLKREGYQRIAFISIDPPYHRSEEFGYETAMQDEGLDYNCSIRTKPSLGEVFKTVRAVLEGLTPPDAMYVSDDNILVGVVEAVESVNRKVGHDVGVITLSNHGVELAPGHEWSRLEFDLKHYGQMIVGNLLWMLENAGASSQSFSVHARWVPGVTHLRD